MAHAHRLPIIAGNWKMHKTTGEAKQLTEAILQGIKNEKELPKIVLCPPFTSLPTVAAAAGKGIDVGAQNMDHHESGAFTGEIAANMLTDLGVTYVIIGHSERRQFFGETNATVNLKLKTALKHKLIPIVCVGETLDERESNLADSVISRQIAAALSDLTMEELKTLVIAYEPVWAIGTGKVCESAEANRVAKLIRTTIGNLFKSKEFPETIPVLYGGSVKASNIEEQLAQSDIDGALVGGASLAADEFLAIIKAGAKKAQLCSSKA
ncbi:MAG: triose-phosphate isomerase [Candidatus Obscuribacterales bacterium]|nr:triose-phosphate isomerase [Candidatus Obscuribacterales bacterium]